MNWVTGAQLSPNSVDQRIRDMKGGLSANGSVHLWLYCGLW